MGYRSEIEWTDATWNPVRGCTKISPGCKHCYAERFAERFRGVAGHPFESGFDLRLIPEKLEAPLKWRKPKRIFVNSMSDLFHEAVPAEYIVRIGEVMREANWHTFQVLTKRHDRMHALLNGQLRGMGTLDNVWWGVSVEDREYGVPRIDVLRHTNARVRFLSVEPLLESLGRIDLSGIDWVIVGGESGVRPRPLSAPGCGSFSNSARPRECHSSSSNGVDVRPSSSAALWTDVNGTTCPRMLSTGARRSARWR